MDLSLLSSKRALCNSAGMKELAAFGAARLRSGAFYSLLFTALVMEKLGEKTLRLNVPAKKPNLAPIAESSSEGDTSLECAEATPSGQSSKPVDTAASQLSNTKDSRKKYGPVPREHAVLIRQMYNTGERVSKIAKQFGISRWACYKIINFRSHADKWEG